MKNPNYKLLKIERPVKILMDADPLNPEEFVIFLNQYSRFNNRGESLEEFLNHTSGFVPVRSGNDRTSFLFNLNEAIYVLEKELVSSVRVYKKINLTFRNHFELEVEHFQNLPDSHPRLLDFLNSEERFLCFLHRGLKIYINKKKIIRSNEYE